MRERGALTTFTEHNFTVRAAEGILLLEGTFALDASADQKIIDCVDSMGPDKGTRLVAIYKLDGGHFIFIAANDGAPRPTVFRAGPGQTMRTFVRWRC